MHILTVCVYENVHIAKNAEDIDCSCTDDEKQIVGAQKYMNTQCPNAGFEDGQK